MLQNAFKIKLKDIYLCKFKFVKYVLIIPTNYYIIIKLFKFFCTEVSMFLKLMLLTAVVELMYDVHCTINILKN